MARSVAVGVQKRKGLLSVTAEQGIGDLPPGAIQRLLEIG
jgi:hypothetical protein